MSRLLTLTLTSHRGRDYPVELFTPDTSFTDSGAVYLFLRMPQGRSLQAQVLYVGEADMLRRQLIADRRAGGVWHRAEAMGFDTIGALALARPGKIAAPSRATSFTAGTRPATTGTARCGALSALPHRCPSCGSPACAADRTGCLNAPPPPRRIHR